MQQTLSGAMRTENFKPKYYGSVPLLRRSVVDTAFPVQCRLHCGSSRFSALGCTQASDSARLVLDQVQQSLSVLFSPQLRGKCARRRSGHYSEYFSTHVAGRRSARPRVQYRVNDGSKTIRVGKRKWATLYVACREGRSIKVEGRGAPMPSV